MLFHDHFYGFRDEETGEELVPGHKVFWQEWDFALANATKFIADHTDSHGHLVWEVEDEENVELETFRKIDRHDQSVEKKTGGNGYKKLPGEYWISRLKLVPGRDWPTYEDWVNKQNELYGD